MRKTLLLSLLALICTMTAGAAVKSPDFAYPKTVIANAEKVYDAACKSGNEKDQLMAAIQIYLADMAIDNSSSDKSIKAFEKRVRNFKSKDIKSLAILFEASAYNAAMIEDMFKFSRRQLPLTPRPADISEWSEEMFHAVVDSLSNEALSLAGKTPIEEFEGIVIAEDLTRSFFPSLRDFAAVYTVNNFSHNGNRERILEICREMVRFHPAHSNAWYAWNTLSINKDKDIFGKKKTKAYLDIYRSMPQETGRAYVLPEIIQNIQNLYLQPSKQVAFVDSALAAFKGYWIENTLLNFRNELVNPSLRISSSGDNIAANSEGIKLNINYTNISSATIKIYNFKDEKTARRSARNGLGAYKPIQTYTLNLGESSPDRRDTTLTVTLPRGCNAITGKIPGVNQKILSPILLNAYELAPVVMSYGKRRVLYVLDALSGAPVKGVYASAVSTRKGGKITPLGTTDADGRLIFDCPDNSDLRLTYNNHTRIYDSFHFSNYEESGMVNNTIGLTTDLGVYKLGADVRYAGFVADTLGAVAGTEIRARLIDSESKTIATDTVKSDAFGRFSGNFKLPDEARTGRFRIYSDDSNGSTGRAYFEVSDFKMPAFKSDSIVVYGAGLTKDYITAEGRIITYTNFPVSDARINIKVSDKDSIYTTYTDRYGRFSLRIDSVFDCEDESSLDKEDLAEMPYEDNADSAMVTISATSPDGTTLDVFTGEVSQYPNELFTNNWHATVDSDSLLTIDVTLLSPQRKLIEGDIVWRIKDKKYDTVLQGEAKSGEIKIGLKSLKPADYKLEIAPADALARVYTRELSVYSMRSDSLPVKGLIWTPDDEMKLKDGKLTARILVASPGVNLYYGYTDRLDNYKHEFLRAGWHTISIKADSTTKRFIKAFTLRDLREISLMWRVPRENKNTELKLTIESFRDKVYTSDNEKWTLNVRDAGNRPVEAAIVLNVYNSKLDVFRTPDVLSPRRSDKYRPDVNFKFPFRGWGRTFTVEGSYTTLKAKSPVWPIWNDYNTGFFFDDEVYFSAFPSLRTRLYGCRAPQMAAKAEFTEDKASDGILNEELTVAYGTTRKMNLTGSVAGIETTMSAETQVETDESPLSRPIDEMRDSGATDMFSALWMPSIVTDAHGKYGLDFKVPNILTTWKVVATAWDRKMNSAHLNKTISVSKPVMVSANMPRFVRAGDRTTVISTVMNNTDSSMSIRINAEAFDVETDSTFATITRDLTINPGAKETVSNDINVPVSMQNSRLGFRVTAISKDYSDGEQIAVPVLDSESFVREAINFYLNPGDTEYSTDLPKAKGRDFKSEFTFTANPMATILDALPTLWNDPFPTATSLSTAYYGARIILSIAKEHPSVAEKFDLREVEKQSEDALKKLYDLQRADGGWSWGSWSSESSEWVTTAVLDKFYDLKRLNYLPEDKKLRKTLTRAVRYVDSRVRDYDLTYAIIRPEFNSLALPSLNGQKVIDRTLNDITRQWKKYDADAKALSVIALTNNSRTATARGIIKSLDQFAFKTPKKGTQFRNERSLIAYGHLLEAYAAADPKSQIVDGLRQYLIVRRQATDWGNRSVTAYVISSFLNSGTRWSQPAVSPAIYLDNSTTPSTMSAPAGDAMVYSATLPTDAKNLRLDVGNAGVPSYGAIVTSYVAPMQDIKAYSENDEISVDKRLLVRDASGHMQDAPRVLQVGQTVTVSITLKTTRPMSYVNVTDQRPATFEPVDQMSHYVGPSFWRATTGNDVAHYRENRDTSTRILIDYLPEGTHVISYDVTVNNAGTYASGIVTATCDRAPSLTAHSAGSVLEVKP